MGSIFLCCPLDPGLWQHVLLLHWEAVMHCKHLRQEGQVHLTGIHMFKKQEAEGFALSPYSCLS